jgi:hypothetical protein
VSNAFDLEAREAKNLKCAANNAHRQPTTTGLICLHLWSKNLAVHHASLAAQFEVHFTSGHTRQQLTPRNKASQTTARIRVTDPPNSPYAASSRRSRTFT